MNARSLAVFAVVVLLGLNCILLLMMAEMKSSPKVEQVFPKKVERGPDVQRSILLSPLPFSHILIEILRQIDEHMSSVDKLSQEFFADVKMVRKDEYMSPGVQKV